MVFAPKRDLWLSILIWLCVGVLVFSAISPFVIGGAEIIETIIVLAICVPCAAFMLWIWLDVSYELRETDLYIRMGPSRKSVPLESIRKVNPVRSLIASTATSIDRLEIHYKAYDMIYISPLHQEAFLAELRRRCPQLKL
ncbi:PH domain-containing protein [Paenibacillus glycanilyticus]|uniref:PH domain-containing protein n=1 Tax=Paenibacillus glycanilyticus TaxID=126569 RepID=UPI00203FA425|nr:PH domain-containing protein [Paenibacillus glycanilyticus]MCM3629564.1 PH domain-containing protein [Paenibacillus glycanilyticus]